MSGHANLDIDIKNYNIYNVPIIIANKETLKGYANIVYDYDNEKVINVIWPKITGRKIVENTGNEALPTEGFFHFEYKNNKLLATNYSVNNGSYEVGVINDNSIYVREANYHPCGGQIVFPTQNIPFLILLSKADDNIKPEDFIAFKCDGTFGIQILPNIWHQPIIPFVKDSAIFKNKQCSVHACVMVDTIEEFNVILKIYL